MAQTLKLPTRTLTTEPWAIGVRLADEPKGVHRYTVRRGAPADGRAIADLHDLPEQSWISFIVRSGGLIQVRGSTELHADDEVLVLGDDDCADTLQAVFEGR